MARIQTGKEVQELMNIDVVVPTYNRSVLLRRTIESLLRAAVPEGLRVTIVVVDNNSKDDTAAMIAGMRSRANRTLVYLKETKVGSSNARNAGIAAGHSELIGFIDDDEEVDEHWFEVVAREFADPATQYIGGPYLAGPDVRLPGWLPPGYNGVIGVMPQRPRSFYGPEFAGNLNSGNAVLRRSVFDAVGLYDPKLGRSGVGLLSEEDAELYRRLQAAGMRGVYVPELVIYHHVPESRLTRTYYRRWCYWRGISHGVADRQQPEPVSYAFGLPRYRIGQAVRGLIALPANLLAGKGSGEAFASELGFWSFLGFVRGKFFTRIERFYAEGK